MPNARPSRDPYASPFNRAWAAAVALVGGLAGVLAFPEFGLWPFAFVSVALLSVAVSGRRARTGGWLGFVYGLGFFVPLVSWTGVYVGPVPWLILAAACAVFTAFLGAILPALARLPGAPFWIGCAWTLEEFLRDRIPFGGFPWGRLAFSQADAPTKWFAAIGGAPLVTFAVALGGGALAVVALSLRPWRVWAAAGALVALVAVPLLGLVAGRVLAPPADRDGRTETVAVVQGGLPDLGLQFESRAMQVLDNHVSQTLLLAREVRRGQVARPSLVLWPEDSSDVDPFQDGVAAAKITRAVNAIGAPILVGAILQGPGPTHRRNVGILWSPRTGPGAEYVKRHPVPFAEYIPLRSLAEKVSPDAKTVTQDMVAGHGNGLLTGGPVPIGDVICFEVAYDSLVRSSVTAGAQLLVVQTNNATFGQTAETYQQLAMGQLRAVETGRTVLQAATTGKSAVIGPDGVIRQESGILFRPALLVATVPVRTALTPADQAGAVPEYVISALAVLGLLAAAVRRANRAGRPAGARTTTAPAPSKSVPEPVGR